MAPMTAATHKKNRFARVAAIMIATTAVGVVGATSAAYASPAKASSSAAGTYKYNDSLGNTKEGLTLKANGTLVFSSGCSGIWVQSGKSIAMDINANCSGFSWIFAGTVVSTGLNTKANPGHLRTNGSTATWYATKV